MQIFVRLPDSRIITLDVEATDTIQNLKGKIQDKEAIPPDTQILTFAGTVLAENRTLGDYNIQTEATIYLTIAGEETTTIATSTTVVGGGADLPHSGGAGTAGVGGLGLALVVAGVALVRTVRPRPGLR